MVDPSGLSHVICNGLTNWSEPKYNTSRVPSPSPGGCHDIVAPILADDSELAGIIEVTNTLIAMSDTDMAISRASSVFVHHTCVRACVRACMYASERACLRLIGRRTLVAWVWCVVAILCAQSRAWCRGSRRNSTLCTLVDGRGVYHSSSTRRVLPLLAVASTGRCTLRCRCVHACVDFSMLLMAHALVSAPAWLHAAGTMYPPQRTPQTEPTNACRHVCMHVGPMNRHELHRRTPWRGFTTSAVQCGYHC